ncbi:MAG: metallophosphoesterase, partial [Myxococcales bacterium]|nr:metallophosphoesterase [Myxococcales bacterium]
LHLGDMAYNTGTTNEFTSNFFAPYEDVLRHTVCWPTMGNHEGASSDSGTQSGPYYDAYVVPTAGEAGGLPSGTEAYYSFDWGNIHFIVLDSHDSDRSPGGPMLSWMQQDLQATDQDWIVAFFHHPPYTKGSHDSDDEGQLVDMRENALPILEAGGVDLVLAGHSHIYERSFLIDGAYATPTTASGHIVDGGSGETLGDGPYHKNPGNAGHEGAVYIVAGHGGAGVSGPANHPVMYFSEVDNGSVILDVQGNRLAVRNIRWDGAVTDRMSLVKGPAIVIGTPDGGETFGAGQVVDVAWATVGNVAEVDIALSADDGASWSTVASAVPNTGSFSWTVPAVATDAGLLRVASTQNAAVQDESNASFAISATVVETSVPFGASWRYDDSGTDHGTAFRDASFDDSGWAEGPAELGYGDGDEATTLTADPVQPTYYFRHRFSIDEGTPVDGALRLIHDDGVVVWINGTEVARRYVDDDSFAAFASSQSQDNEAYETAVAAGVIQAGENVVTAIVKQASAGSSDVSFALELKTTVMLPPPPPGTGGGSGVGGRDAGGGNPTGGQGAAGGASINPENEDGGCGCTTPGEKAPSGGPALLLLAVVAGLRRRRRR